MRPSIAFYAALASALFVRVTLADGDEGWEGDGFIEPTPFQISTAPIGGVKAATEVAAAHTASSRIVAIDDGALVADADSGLLIRTDAKGAKTGELAIGENVGLLVYDDVAKRAYVADRQNDRIVVVAVGVDKLATLATWKTPAEPYGVALTPDRKALLVSTIADRTLVGFDVTTGVEGFRTSLGAEPRGLAIAPDGSRVVVASLATGTLEQIGLANRREVRRIALPAPADTRARGAFNVAFVGTMAVAPFQQEIPVAKFASDTGHYGGSFTPPVSHELAFFAPDGREAFGITNVNEPRAVVWDAKRDVLYLAGLASDGLVSIKRASQIDVAAGVEHGLAQRCGADGIALAPDGDVLVWCSFTRTVARFEHDDKGKLAKVAKGPELTPSKLDAARHAGMVTFHTASTRISGFGGMSCGNCHLDGRADGLSWKIGKHELQTPVLAGRMAGTAPFKWDGGAKDLQKSLKETIGRLGGTGLKKTEIASLAAFVEGMPAIRTPTRTPDMLARGKKVFDSEEAGCRSCHDGPKYTDREQHDFVGAKGSFDTPSLLGLAASAPYFHDGSAATLEGVLRDRGRIHGMAPGTTKLSERDLTDLVAFLESL